VVARGRDGATAGRFARHRWGVAATALLERRCSRPRSSARAYLQAEAARARPTSFDEAREMTRFMLFDLHDELRRIPGTADMRLLLAEQGERYLQRLAAVPDAPATVTRDVAVAYRKLGAVLGVPGEGTVGRTAEAFAALQASERLLETLRRAAPADDGVVIELARTRLIAARVHYFADTTMDECARLNASGLALLDAVLQRQQDNQIARLWQWSARVYQAEGRVQDRQFAQALSELRQLAAERRQHDDPEFRTTGYASRRTSSASPATRTTTMKPGIAGRLPAGAAVLERAMREKAMSPLVTLAHARWNVAYVQADPHRAASLANTRRPRICSSTCWFRS
jgi:hypothetical protein